MEWEYLQALLKRRNADDSRWYVTLLDAVGLPAADSTLNALGADRWEICSTWQHGDVVHVVFKRIKLYEVGSTPWSGGAPKE